jgi:hypothetical protein
MSAALPLLPLPRHNTAGSTLTSTDDPETIAALQALETMPYVTRLDQKDTPDSILSTWISLEVLAPVTYKDPVKLAGDDRTCIAKIGHDQPPWERGEPSRPNYKLFYLVVFGEVSMDTTMEDLLRAFGDNDETPKRQGTRAPVAMAIVDKQGKLAGPETITVSSFAWGLPVVLPGKMGCLGRRRFMLQAQTRQDVWDWPLEPRHG